MENIIDKIKENSIAEEMGLEPGDKLIAINNSPVVDVIDYKFLLCDEEILVKIEKQNGEEWELDIEKDYDEDLGISFKNSIMDNAKSCCNKCIFCFIDQLPKGMRKSLYFKDDDSRLSFLQGNFVTLTNLKDSDIDRIIKYRISPINISVHTTNPDLRVKMLNNKSAGNIMERLKKLKNAGISMNCQLVLCKGINDGKELIKTVEDLSSFYPYIKNVAAVPVGVTKFRENLYPLETFNKDSAKKAILDVSRLNEDLMKKIGEPFIRLSDEFYVLAGVDVPPYDYYNGFSQLEDGVGMIRIFRHNIKSTIKDLKPTSDNFLIITGVSAFDEIKKASDLINEKGVNVKVLKVKNDYFGETITVAGLLTGTDIKKAIIEYKKHSNVDYIVLPENMLRSGEDVFLDDVTLKELQEDTNSPILVCSYTGDDLIDIINNKQTRRK